MQSERSEQEEVEKKIEFWKLRARPCMHIWINRHNLIVALKGRKELEQGDLFLLLFARWFFRSCVAFACPRTRRLTQLRCGSKSWSANLQIYLYILTKVDNHRQSHECHTHTQWLHSEQQLLNLLKFVILLPSSLRIWFLRKEIESKCIGSRVMGYN